MAALLVIPTLFYLPKFFEYDSVTMSKSLRYIEPCSPENRTECFLDPNDEKTWIKHEFAQYNFTELRFSSLRQNYYYRRVRPFYQTK